MPPVAAGYPVGLILDNEKGTTQTWANNGDLKIMNVYFAGMGIIGSDINKGFNDLLSTDGKTVTDENQISFSHSYFLKDGLNNKYFETIAELGLNKDKIFAPSAGSPLTGSAGFNDALLQDAFFEKVSFIGAFKSDSDVDNWTSGWANFDPQNTDY